MQIQPISSSFSFLFRSFSGTILIYLKINGYLCSFKRKKVLRLVIYMSAMLLMLLATTTANEQENTTWQEAMPHEYTAHCTLIQQETTERTIDHLYNEHLILPVYATGEVPGYHPHHSKPKCLHHADRSKWHDTHGAFTNGLLHHRSTIHQHAIDYYIYTLEHILI